MKTKIKKYLQVKFLIQVQNSIFPNNPKEEFPHKKNFLKASKESKAVKRKIKVIKKKRLNLRILI